VPELYPYPRFSLAERDRRWRAVRELMARQGIDIIVTPNNSGNSTDFQADSRYLTHCGGGGDADVAAVFPLDGEVTAIATSAKLRWLSVQEWTRDVREANRRYGKAIVERLKELKPPIRRIGITGLGAVLARPDVEFRNERGGRGSHVCPVKSEVSFDRVGLLLHREMKFTSDRFRGTLQAIAVHVVEPAMISAGESSLFDPAVGERRAAMGTAVGEKTDSALVVTEQRQVFAENSHELGGIFFRQLARDGNRMPVTAKQFARRRSRSHPSQQFVFFPRQHRLAPLRQ